VTHVLLYDPKPVVLSEIGHRRPDIAEMTTFMHLSNTHPQGLFGHIDQTLCLGADLSNRHREGGVTVKSLVYGSSVD